MAKFGVLIYKSNQKKDGSFPVCLRITKDGKRKYIDLGLTAKEDQWNEETARFKKDKRVILTMKNIILYLTITKKEKMSY